MRSRRAASRKTQRTGASNTAVGIQVGKALGCSVIHERGPTVSRAHFSSAAVARCLAVTRHSGRLTCFCRPVLSAILTFADVTSGRVIRRPGLNRCTQRALSAPRAPRALSSVCDATCRCSTDAPLGARATTDRASCSSRTS